MKESGITTGVIAIIVIAVIIVAGISAYVVTRPEELPPGEEEEEEEEERLKVAFVLAGTLTDASWNAGMYKAAYEVAAELDLDIAVSEGVGYVNPDAYFIDYATKGYKIIFGHTLAYSDSMQKVAEDFPDVWFIHCNTIPETVGGNVASYSVFRMDQGAYLAGIVAGGITKTNKIGAVSGLEVPHIKYLEFYAFAEGARSVNPNIQFVDVYTGSWIDLTRGRETAITMIEEGVDVILSHGDGLTLGVIQAGSMYSDVYVIGYVSDQNPLASDTIITSNIFDFKVPVRNLITKYIEGTLEGKIYEYGMEDNAVYLAPFYGLEEVVPENIKTFIEEVEENIRLDIFEVPHSPEWPY